MIEIVKTRSMEEDSYTIEAYDIKKQDIVIGAASVLSDNTSAYVDRIDIDEAFRNNGFGTEALEALSRLYGSIDIAPDNENAQRLYARLGLEMNVCAYEDYGYIYDQGFGVYTI